MNDNTSWTPAPEENLKGLTDKTIINEFEAKGIAAAELFIFSLDIDVSLSISLILEIHKVSFKELYDWAGKWRTKNVVVGQLEPPEPSQVPNLMYQFVDNVNYKLSISTTRTDHINLLVYAHYEFIRIHPFNNGNGRTGRNLVNILALKLGYQPLQLYHRQGEARKVYLKAMKATDKGDLFPLSDLIAEELIPF